jgi:hypothetical protein
VNASSRKKNMRMELRQKAGEDGIVSGSCPVARVISSANPSDSITTVVTDVLFPNHWLMENVLLFLNNF